MRLLIPCALATCACVMAALPGSALADHSVTAASDVPGVTALQVHLFEHKTGHWSDNVLVSAPDGLWNSISGPKAANAALIVVEVHGQANARYAGRSGTLPRYALRLVASERGRAVLDKTQPLPVMAGDGRAYLPFLVRPDGCTPLKLKATLVGPQATAPLEALVPFACGE